MAIKKNYKCFLMMVIIILFVVIFLGYSFFKANKSDELLISYFYDGSVHDEAPEKSKLYDAIFTSCDNATAVWDKSEWKLKVYNITGKVKCELQFLNTNYYKEDILGDTVELYPGLTAVTIDSDGTVKIADPTSEWYSYADHEWANAVVLAESAKNKSVGDTLSMDDILQMYVWIPRYRYKLWNAENGLSSPQMIEIEFESVNDKKQEGSQNGQWLTHPAFTFGTTELAGIWVGKFETSSTKFSTSNCGSLGCSSETCSGGNTLRIKPNSNALRNQSFLEMYLLSRSIESQSIFDFYGDIVDTHMMKNMEWGAVAYLTNSKYGRYVDKDTCIDSGCDIWTNPYYDDDHVVKTGCSGTTEDEKNIKICKEWNDATYGGNSSTTGNLYGIYDMSGGSWEYVGGYATTQLKTLCDEDGYCLNPRYYDYYVSVSAVSLSGFSKTLKLGDATKEVINSSFEECGKVAWYGQWVCPGAFSARGGSYYSGSDAGLFNHGGDNGEGAYNASWHSVITVSD